MDIFIIAILVVAAVILFLVELFIIPGISIAGFLAGGCIIMPTTTLCQFRSNSRIHHTCHIRHHLRWFISVVHAFQNPG